ncbi:hypothetical protein [Paraburkholderia sp. A1RO-5L]|uniref:hypothetical protein n=1 Tax=Paraburkholderia sp. A1RO-5L TaxID=3028370 RepID=UPI003B806286
MTEQHERAAYTFPLGSRERIARRLTGPLFDSNVLHYLAAGAVLHVIDEPADIDAAIKFAVALSVLQFSRHASSPAA